MKRLTSISRRNFVVHSATALAGAATWIPAGAAAAPSSAVSAGDQEIPPAISRILSKWIISTQARDVPDAVRSEAIRSIVNWVGVALGGSRQDAVLSAIAALEPYCQDGKAILFGHGERFDPMRAALINGISSHVLEYDDTHLSTIIHPAGPVSSALFALSQYHPLTGSEFVHAFIVGTEVECKLGRNEFHRKRSGLAELNPPEKVVSPPTCTAPAVSPGTKP